MATALPAGRAQELETENERAAAELAASLTAQLPSIPSKYFYDDVGSRLFEQITELPEYYQTRTEWSILSERSHAIVELARPDELIELGAGNGRKIGALLEAMRARGAAGRCTLLDINESFVQAAARRLRLRYPGLGVRGLRGDFLSDLDALIEAQGAGERMFVFFAGTFGNLLPEERERFLTQVASALADGGTLLVGLDLIKDRAVLEAAYNDAAGVTAAFNLNVLRVVNRLTGGDFDLSAFAHRAFYDSENEWVEMRLQVLRDHHVRLPACDLVLDLQRGDEIRTEISAKFSRASLTRVLAGSGLEIAGWFSDPAELFALALLRRGDT